MQQHSYVHPPTGKQSQQQQLAMFAMRPDQQQQQQQQQHHHHHYQQQQQRMQQHSMMSLQNQQHQLRCAMMQKEHQSPQQMQQIHMQMQNIHQRLRVLQCSVHPQFGYQLPQRADTQSHHKPSPMISSESPSSTTLHKKRESPSDLPPGLQQGPMPPAQSVTQPDIEVESKPGSAPLQTVFPKGADVEGHLLPGPRPCDSSLIFHGLSQCNTAWSCRPIAAKTLTPGPSVIRGSRADKMKGTSTDRVVPSQTLTKPSLLAASCHPDTPSSASSDPSPPGQTVKSPSDLAEEEPDDDDASNVVGDSMHGCKGNNKHRIIKVGRFKCPWTSCCHQRARLGYGWIRDLETHLRSLACGRSGQWRPKFNHSRLAELTSNYGPSVSSVPKKPCRRNSPDVASPSSPSGPGAVESTKARSPTNRSDANLAVSEARLRVIVQEEAQKVFQSMLSPLAVQLADVHKLLSPFAGIPTSVSPDRGFRAKSPRWQASAAPTPPSPKHAVEPHFWSQPWYQQQQQIPDDIASPLVALPAGSIVWPASKRPRLQDPAAIE